MTKEQFKITGMHCTSCAMNIEGELEDLQGIIKADVNFPKQITHVEYDEKIVSAQQIITTIEKLGYQVSQS
ncbi:MAG: heavy-metal-associated domain-containing protein [Phototrophicales bacterium]|mgnify:CR=1 FL=1|nr:heavy-metal-associated domain-containing protein [Phototrophicales bacterium]